jgi:hypothetical protein
VFLLYQAYLFPAVAEYVRDINLVDDFRGSVVVPGLPERICTVTITESGSSVGV